jgi:GINS complex subunit 1
VTGLNCNSAEYHTLLLALGENYHPSSMAAESRQFCELANQLLMESRRSTATDTLLKYNDGLVRAVLREQRDLDKLVASLLDAMPLDADVGSVPPAILIYQSAIARNKRCLLAYHAHRMDRLRDMYWAAGGSLPHLLSSASDTAAGDIRSRLSPHEADYLRMYNENIMHFRSAFAAELDITANLTQPPKDLHIAVRVVRDCGVIQTEIGEINFKKGERIVVRRADVEHLIMQGYLEEV